MGNGNSKKDYHQTKHEQYDIKINHQKFNHFKYLEAQDLIQITNEVESQKDIKVWDNDLKRLNTFQDKEALLLPTRHQFTPRGFCGNLGSVRIYYQNYPYLFEQQIENRINMNKHFEQQQLWYLLYSLVSSAKDFNLIDKKVGDIRPYNIFINEEGQIKIANIFSWPYQKTNFDKTAFEKQLTYISPEEMRLISKGNHQNTTNKVLSQSFSIGLTLLQSGLLFNVKQLYSIEHYSFDWNKLNQRVGQWQNLQFQADNNTYDSYSPLLKSIVTRLCNTDQNTRLSSLDVQLALRPYQNEISNLKEFDHSLIQLSGGEVVSARPVQVEYISSGVRPVSNAPVLRIPQQTIKVNTQIEPKVNSNSPNIGEIHANVGPVRFTTTEYVPQQQTQIYQQQFHKYATSNGNTPTYQATQNQTNTAYRTQLPTQYFEQQFHKYSNLITNPKQQTNQSNNLQINLPPSNALNNYNSTIQTNALNYQTGNAPNLTFNQQAFNQTKATFAPTFTTSNYTPTTFNSQFSRPINVVQTTSQVVPPIILPPSNDNSSDFLRKIDEQLEHSRRQFPS